MPLVMRIYEINRDMVDMYVVKYVHGRLFHTYYLRYRLTVTSFFKYTYQIKTHTYV